LAFRAVNEAFSALQEDDRPVIAATSLDAEVDAAFAADDRSRALRAVEAWKAHNLSTIRRAADRAESAGELVA